MLTRLNCILYYYIYYGIALSVYMYIYYMGLHHLYRVPAGMDISI